MAALLEEHRSMFPRGPPEGVDHCWNETAGTKFNVRGKSYLEDGVKVQSAPSILDVLDVDLIESDIKIDHIAELNDCFVQKALRAGESRYMLIVQIQAPPQSLIVTLAWDPTKEKDGGNWLFETFIASDDEFRDTRFKVIPNVVDGPWALRKAVGTKPAILGSALTLSYFQTPQYLEIDCNVESSSTANTVIGLIRGWSSNVTLDLGFVVECQSQDELPERMLGGVRLTAVDLNLARQFDFDFKFEDDNKFVDDDKFEDDEDALGETALMFHDASSDSSPAALLDGCREPPSATEEGNNNKKISEVLPADAPLDPASVNLPVVQKRNWSGLSASGEEKIGLVGGVLSESSSEGSIMMRQLPERGTHKAAGLTSPVPLFEDDEEVIEEQHNALPRVVSGSTFRAGAEDGTHCWSEPDTTNFSVRGANYLKDKLKVNSLSSIMELVDCDIYEVGGPKLDHVAQYMDSFVQRAVAAGDPRFFFVVQFQAAPATLAMTWALKKPRGPHGSPGELLFDAFVSGDDDFRRERLKVVPTVVKGPWVLSSAVGKKPAILAKTLTNLYYQGDSYLEVDIDLLSGTVASYTVGMVRGQSTGIVIDLGFVVEGLSPAELPELMLGAVRLSRADLELARWFDASLPIKIPPPSPRPPSPRPRSPRASSPRRVLMGDSDDDVFEDATEDVPEVAPTVEEFANGWFPRAPEGNSTTDAVMDHTWSECDAASFSIRGETYVADGKKSPSSPALMTLLNVDLYSSTSKFDNFASDGNSFAAIARRAGERRFLFVLQFQASPHTCCVTWALNDEEDGSAAHLLWNEFICGSEEFRAERLKVIPNVMLESWLLSKVVGSMPFCVGTQLAMRQYKTDSYLEIDCNLSSSAAASRVAALFRSQAGGISIDFGVLVEGRHDTELPERLAGTFRVTRALLGRARQLPEEDPSSSNDTVQEDNVVRNPERPRGRTYVVRAPAGELKDLHCAECAISLAGAHRGVLRCDACASTRMLCRRCDEAQHFSEEGLSSMGWHVRADILVAVPSSRGAVNGTDENDPLLGEVPAREPACCCALQ